jgi:hypothetical protein
MKNRFSPSINIIRDQDKDFKYIPTTNAERVILQLNECVNVGIKSFYLVGSYGTGKSSFLWALEKQITKGEQLFKTPISFNGRKKYSVLNIIGDYCSLEDSIREALDIHSKREIIKELNSYYDNIQATNKGLLIVIDEFGKFLEYASKNNPEKELYMIQQLAEFANDYRKNIIFLTTLHQGFDSYKSKLDEKIKNEWDKVKGRLKELTFNEPVEQLLHLAAEHLNGNASPISNRDFNQLFYIIQKSRVYPLANSLNKNLANQLFPLDLLSSGVLAKALQRYGQNERSLFTFLETIKFSDYISKGSQYFNINSVCDYLLNNYYSLLSSKYNPDFIKWSVLRNSLERNEILFEKDSESKERLIKTIGLLNIFAPHGARINKEFLTEYGKLALAVEKVEEQLKQLEAKKIIRYQTYSDTYVLFEGTDIDIDLALNDAENYIIQNPSIISKLKEYFVLPYVPVRASYLERGTPRFFEYILSESPITKRPYGEIDGYVNLIFNKRNNVKEVIEISQNMDEAILYAIHGNTEKIEEIIKEIDKINYVLENTIEDRVVQRELKNLRDLLINELNDLVIDSLFDKKSKIVWIFNGKKIEIGSKLEFNKILSEITNNIYNAVPIFLNELVNREKLPAAITVARKVLLQNLLNSWNKEDLGFDNEKYPPEKTIYLSLLKSTGIHRKENEEYLLAEPKNDSFAPIWEASEKFFVSSKVSKKSLQEFYNILSQKPFKLKKGFIDFWIPIYLTIKRDDYALFDGDIYIPNLSPDFFDAFNKNPQNYFIKAFDIQGIKFDLFNRYRAIINSTKENKISNKVFVDTIRPFLVFYRELPEYTKKTKRLTKGAIALRSAIINAKDPEKTFFEDFPLALSYTTIDLYKSQESLENFTKQLQNCIREIRSSYSELINRIEAYLLNLIGDSSLKFPEYKNILVNRYSSLKKYLLLPHQKSFYTRLILESDDRKSWLSSIVSSLMNKNLENIDDNEEEIIYEKLSNILKEFDNLSEITENNIDPEHEEAIKIEITPLKEVPKKEILIINKQMEKKSQMLEKEIDRLLQGQRDKNVRKFVLLKLLKEYLNNE